MAPVFQAIFVLIELHSIMTIITWRYLYRPTYSGTGVEAQQGESWERLQNINIGYFSKALPSCLVHGPSVTLLPPLYLQNIFMF